MDGTVVYVIGIDIPDGTDEEAFHEWYNQHHVPEVVGSRPGILRGTRFEILEPEEGYPRFLAIYEIESPEEFREFRAMSAKRKTGELPAYTPGPPHKVKWIKAYRRIGP